MSALKKTLLVATIGALAVASVFASSGTRPANNERGYTAHAMPASGLTRDQVRTELEAFKRNPTSADGARYVGGELGWENRGHKSEWRDGKLVHADAIDHNAPRASESVTPQTRAEFQKLYPGR